MNVTEKNALQYGIFFILLGGLALLRSLSAPWASEDYRTGIISGLSIAAFLAFGTYFLIHFGKQRRKQKTPTLT